MKAYKSLKDPKSPINFLNVEIFSEQAIFEIVSTNNNNNEQEYKIQNQLSLRTTFPELAREFFKIVFPLDTKIMSKLRIKAVLRVDLEELSPHFTTNETLCNAIDLYMETDSKLVNMMQEWKVLADESKYEAQCAFRDGCKFYWYHTRLKDYCTKLMSKVTKFHETVIFFSIC